MTVPAAIGDLQSAPEKGLKFKTRAQKRAPLIINNIQETSITIVEQNLDQISQLQLLAEQQFAALVQAQLALGLQLETIKNNIRVNHFKSRFSTVNTVIVTVTQVIDIRDAAAVNRRYMVNQLLADNGFPDQEVVVMVSALEVLTISAPTATVGFEDLLSAFATGGAGFPSATGLPTVGRYDPSAPFGNINESIILPFGAEAPTTDLVFADPASIILEGQHGLFVESTDSFLSDCGFYRSNGNSFFNLATRIFTSFTQLTSFESLGVTLTGALPSFDFGGKGKEDKEVEAEVEAEEDNSKGKKGEHGR